MSEFIEHDESEYDDDSEENNSDQGQIITIKRNSIKYEVDSSLRDIDGSVITIALNDSFDAVAKLYALSNSKLISATEYEITVWDTASFQCLYSLKGHVSDRNIIVELSDGNIASETNDGKVRIWNINDGNSIHVLEHDKGEIPITAMLQLSDGRLATAGNAIYLWDLTTKEYTKMSSGDDCIFSLIQLKNGNLLAGCEGGRFYWFDLNSDTNLGYYWHRDNWAIRSLVELPNGHIASAGNEDADILIWDLYCDNTVVKKLSCGFYAHDDYIGMLKGRDGGIYSLQLLSNGRMVSCAWDNKIKIWDVDNLSCCITIDSFGRQLIVLSDDRLVVCSDSNQIVICDSNDGKLIKTLGGHDNYILSIVQLSDGRLASLDCGNKIKIWEV
jgi:WD40 repeat protein